MKEGESWTTRREAGLKKAVELRRSKAKIDEQGSTKDQEMINAIREDDEYEEIVMALIGGRYNGKDPSEEAIRRQMERDKLREAQEGSADTNQSEENRRKDRNEEQAAAEGAIGRSGAAQKRSDGARRSDESSKEGQGDNQGSQEERCNESEPNSTRRERAADKGQDRVNEGRGATGSHYDDRMETCAEISGSQLRISQPDTGPKAIVEKMIGDEVAQRETDEQGSQEPPSHPRHEVRRLDFSQTRSEELTENKKDPAAARERDEEEKETKRRAQTQIQDLHRHESHQCKDVQADLPTDTGA